MPPQKTPRTFPAAPGEILEVTEMGNI